MTEQQIFDFLNAQQHEADASVYTWSVVEVDETRCRVRLTHNDTGKVATDWLFYDDMSADGYTRLRDICHTAIQRITG